MAAGELQAIAPGESLQRPKGLVAGAADDGHGAGAIHLQVDAVDLPACVPLVKHPQASGVVDVGDAPGQIVGVAQGVAAGLSLHSLQGPGLLGETALSIVAVGQGAAGIGDAGQPPLAVVACAGVVIAVLHIQCWGAGVAAGKRAVERIIGVQSGNAPCINALGGIARRIMGVAGAGGVGDIGGARAIDAGRQAVGVVDVRPGAAGGLGGQQAAKQQGCTQGQGQQALAGKTEWAGRADLLSLKFF